LNVVASSHFQTAQAFLLKFSHYFVIPVFTLK
jgi:hypothetical protein